jgi:hypothetical protein
MPWLARRPHGRRVRTAPASRLMTEGEELIEAGRAFREEIEVRADELERHCATNLATTSTSCWSTSTRVRGDRRRRLLPAAGRRHLQHRRRAAFRLRADHRHRRRAVREQGMTVSTAAIGSNSRAAGRPRKRIFVLRITAKWSARSSLVSSTGAAEMADLGSHLRGGIPSFRPRTGRTTHHLPTPRIRSHLLSSTEQHERDHPNAPNLNHTIFEGTSEIQQLVIARAISGLRIE